MKKLPTLSASPAASIAAVKNFAKAGSSKISVIGAIAGAGMDMVSATRDERAFLSDLVDEYRPEIAKRLGLAEKQVTAEHFDAAFRENPVLAQAKETTSMKRAVRIVSNAVSVGFGIVAGMSAAFFVRRGQQTEGMQENAASIAGTLAASFGGWSAGKLTRQVLHKRKLGTALEGTAHNQIMVIKNKQQMGQPTDAADIFRVQLAVNPQVGEAIQQAFGKPFSAMQAGEQRQLLENEFPDILKMNDEMARRINEGARPQGLLFADVEDVKAKESEKKTIGTPQIQPAAQPQPLFEAQEAPAQTQDAEMAPAAQSTAEASSAPEVGVEKEGQQAKQDAASQPTYNKAQREAVQSAIKEVLRSRQENPATSYTQGIERERAQQEAAPQEARR